jgi:phytoene dehydrogenase-like protein
MPMTDIDVLLVGGGHNGLVCAGYLAKAGKKVLVLEAADVPGGMVANREIAPGYTVPGCAQWMNILSPEVSSDLSLGQHGLQYAAQNLPSVSLSADGKHLKLSGEGPSGAGVTADDQQAYRELKARMDKYSRLLAKVFSVRAPKVVESNLADRITLFKLGLGMKMMGREDMSEFLRIVMINMYDLMDETFDNEQLKALLSLEGVMGAFMGPRSPSTVFGYMYRNVSSVFGYSGSSLVKGGMGAFGEALATAVKSLGVEVRTSAEVASIDVEAGRAVGVTLASGETLRAPVVVSNVDPVTTFEKLVGYRNVEVGTARRVSQIRYRSGTAKVHLALDGLPAFTGLDASDAGSRLVIAPDMNYIERAFNAVKYREFSDKPALDISIPSVHDSNLAPSGKHVMSIIVQYAPYELKAGWEDSHQVFLDGVIRLLEEYAPGITGQIVASELLTPEDLEREYRVKGGNWHHGELSMDQMMMMRPYTGASQYGTEVDGLYLCGAGAHPGGGVMGLVGRNAAREIIKRKGAA